MEKKLLFRCKVILILIAFFHLLPGSALAQSRQVTVEATVTTKDGVPLVGVTVVRKGSTQGVATNEKGYCKIAVPENSVLTFSYLGYLSQDITIRKEGPMKVFMQEDVQSVDEVVVVGYGTQVRTTVTGAVSTLKSDEIMQAPTANVSNALAGRVPGLITKQSSGMPGSDDATLRVRGLGTFASSGGVLVLVDGVERAYSQLDPEEIESFTILKDAASTAVYGVKGAQGVLLVTTKRGKEGPAKVSFSTNIAMLTPTRLPKSVSSYDYASLYNEAQINDNPLAIPYYQDDELAKYKDGSDPIFYPNMNWLDATTDKWAIQQKYNVNVSGGTKFARYFVSLGYLSQDGHQKELNQAYDFSNKDSYRRLNIRSNVDMSLTKSTTLGITLGVINGRKNRTLGYSIFDISCRTPPNTSPGFVDGRLLMLTNRSENRNPLWELTKGYTEYYDNHMDITLNLNQNLDFITRGLTFKIKGAFDMDYSQSVSRSKTEQYFVPELKEIDGVETIVYRPVGEVGQLNQPSTGFSNRKKRYYGDVSLNYNRSFGRHNVTAMALMNISKRYYNLSSYASTPSGYIEYVGRVTYNFDQKYLVEFNIGINGSENFPKSNRFGYFPAVSAGWVVSNEKFFRDHIPASIVSYLKFRASYGEVGNDNLGGRRFMYFPSKYSSYVQDAYENGMIAFGETPVNVTRTKEDAQGNPDVTWETARKQNYAVDAKFLKDRLSFTFEYFRETRENILTAMNTIPMHVGISSGTYNIGKAENHGIDMELGYSQAIRDFSFYIKANYSFARNKVIYRDEVLDKDNPQLWGTGRRIGEVFGYVQEGFFNSQEEIDNWPSQFGVTLSPGDVKYRDVNGDGVVDNKDQVPLGHPNFPEIGYGISGGITWKNFDMSFLFQGAAHVSLAISGSFQRPFTEKGTIFDFQKEGRWTPQNTAGAKFPKLSIQQSQAQNYYTSSLWLRDASYLRLKNVEVGYSFRPAFLTKVGISGLRLYFSANNLFVWDSLDGITDPENKATGEGINYPQMKIFNVGLNVKF